MEEIRFGTSGWRGIIADDFTFERSRLVVAAVARYLKESGESHKGVIIGYDTRFMGPRFSEDAADLMARLGIDVLLCSGPVPTPTLSSIVLGRKLGGCINFTASHNPPEYQGIKFSPSWGGPALPETTTAIESSIRDIARKGITGFSGSPGQVRQIDPAPEYLEDLAGKVDFGVIAGSELEVVFDALYGTGAGFLDRILTDAGCRVRTIHANPDPLFGGASPEPSEDRLEELAAMVSGRKALGVATDGDADRFGIVGGDGKFYSPNQILALLAEYLLSVRGVEGDLARSVATTDLLDRIAEAHGRRCHITPVGFKFIGEMISKNTLAMGGEESAGMSIRGHVPEKDGILACLLVAEMMAATGKPLSVLQRDLEEKYGARLSTRVNIHLTDRLVQRLRSILRSPPREVGGLRSDDVILTDGTKWVFPGGDWVLLRLSGTEPVARLYVEASCADSLSGLESGFKEWIGADDGAGDQTL